MPIVKLQVQKRLWNACKHRGFRDPHRDHTGTTPCRRRSNTVATPTGSRADEEGRRQNEERIRRKAEGNSQFGSGVTSVGYAIHLRALPEEFWGNAGAGNRRLLILARAQGAKPRLGPARRSSTSGHVYDTWCCKFNTTARRLPCNGVHDNVMLAWLRRTELPDVGHNTRASFTFRLPAIPKRFHLTMLGRACP